MMLHPAIAQQLVAERQRDLLDHASRHRLARTASAALSARSARTARPATANRTRPSLLRWARVALATH